MKSRILLNIPAYIDKSYVERQGWKREVSTIQVVVPALGDLPFSTPLQEVIKDTTDSGYEAIHTVNINYLNLDPATLKQLETLPRFPPNRIHNILNKYNFSHEVSHVLGVQTKSTNFARYSLNALPFTKLHIQKQNGVVYGTFYSYAWEKISPTYKDWPDIIKAIKTYGNAKK